MFKQEFERIHALGGCVKGDKVQGTLKYSRAIGDFYLKGIEPLSEETELKIEDNDHYAIIATSGIFSTLSDELIGKFSTTCNTAKELAYLLRNAAISCNTPTNITCIVLDLRLKLIPVRGRSHSFTPHIDPFKPEKDNLTIELL